MVYLNKRLKEENSLEEANIGTAGPVITISREVGCNGLKLARLIAQRLDKRKLESEWKVLSKEVFYESAKELDLHPERVRKIFKKTDNYTFEHILKAFGDRRYKSEQKIVKTVIEVIRSLAMDGYCIIVGRAGHIITNDIKNALHIRLTAPIEYRVSNIMQNNKLNHEEALAFVKKVEIERESFRRAIDKQRLHEEVFDITIHRETFRSEQVVDLIELAVDKKGILDGYKQKIDFF